MKIPAILTEEMELQPGDTIEITIKSESLILTNKDNLGD